MSRSTMLATISLSGLMLFAAAAAQASIVTCESTNNEYRSCPVDASGGVRLSQQLSTKGCWENDTWGYDRNKIWVDRGCRAQFQVGAQSTNSAGKGDALAAAAVVGIAAAAIIASSKHDDHHNKNQNKNYSNSYNNGYNYNYDNRYDGKYDSRYNDSYRNYDNSRYGYNGYGGDPRRTFTCESRNDKRNYCSIPGRGHVEIYKQRSSKPCRHGHSWGVEGNSVWVEDGCRAEFAVF
jgi:uncharacterized protein YraI